MDRQTIQERFGIIGGSAAIRHVIDQVRLVARTDATVLIEGESGVGKEIIARTVHALSSRKHGRLVIVNCGAIPEGLIESELFGSEKGAYTGAVGTRTGYFEEADKGTVFLDEIGEMPLSAQVRLLRVLESGEFSRVGSSTLRSSDARVIAATNKHLADEVRKSRFREDLFYRLATVIIEIPPLRDRRDDILPLFENFLHQLSQEYGNAGLRLEDSARELLLRYRWPGNVRELRNVAERVAVLHRGERLTDEDIRPLLRGAASPSAMSGLVPVSEAGAGSATQRERELIYRALLELRMEIRDLKRAMAAAGVAAPVDEESGRETGFVYYDKPADRDRFEDALFEIADDLPGRARALPPGPAGKYVPEVGDDNGRADAGAAADSDDDVAAPGYADQEELPTLESAERDLIVEALRRFEGNRRQTARALGISERTLYRKIRQMEEEGQGVSDK